MAKRVRQSFFAGKTIIQEKTIEIRMIFNFLK